MGSLYPFEITKRWCIKNVYWDSYLICYKLLVLCRMKKVYSKVAMYFMFLEKGYNIY